MNDIPCVHILDPNIQALYRNVTLIKVLSINDKDFDFHSHMIDSELCYLLSGQCQDIALTKLGPQGKIGIPYLLTNNASNYGSPMLLVAKTTPFNKRFTFGVNSLIPSNNSCFGLTNKEYIGLDEFTNETVVGYIIHDLYQQTDQIKIGHDFAVLYYYGGICGKLNLGCDIIEYCDLGTLHDMAVSTKTIGYRGLYNVSDPITGEVSTKILIHENVLKTILNQVASGLHFLITNIQFVSGDLKPDNILVISQQVKGQYKSLDVSGSFKCKIADFGKSSCTIKKGSDAIRIYNQSYLANTYENLFSFKPNIYFDINGESYYIVDETFAVQILPRLRHSSLPYYRSFDYYTFMVSLLLLEEYYYTFFSGTTLINKYWVPLWLNIEDATEMQNIIYERMITKERFGYESVIDILRDKRLRCSVIDTIVG